jgi:ubiquitin fusion degradation protein 1
MMNKLQVKNGEIVNIKQVLLPPGKVAEFEWQDEAFVNNISDQRAVLERALKDYFTLTPDDMICFNYNHRTYHLRVVRIQPESTGGISTLNTDLIVEFCAPPGYEEAKRQSTETKVWN